MCQLSEALRALGAMVAGDVGVERCAAAERRRAWRASRVHGRLAAWLYCNCATPAGPAQPPSLVPIRRRPAPARPCSAARTVAALEQHASHLMLRVLLGGAPPGLSHTDATQGLAFLAMLFNATSVARLLCPALGAAFCAGDGEGQAAAAALLKDPARWAADDRLVALASELLSEALTSVDDEAAAPPAAMGSPAAAAGPGAGGAH